MIVDYIVKNGTLERTELQNDPFRNLGTVTELFNDNLLEAKKILGIIDEITYNAYVVNQ